MLKLIILLVNFYSIYARSALPQEIPQILDFHNRARREVYPPASDMQAMNYNSELAYLAESWARRCQFAHPTRDDPLYKNTGQNIAISFGHPRVDFPFVIENWHKERIDYNYEENSCTPGKKCGHYTQMVWSTSTNVGCAVERCDMHFRGHPQPTYLYVCQYRSPGNYLGEKPYKAGTSCKNCPRGTSCINKLCYSG